MKYKIITLILMFFTLSACGKSSDLTSKSTFDYKWKSVGGYKDADTSPVVKDFIVVGNDIYLATSRGVYLFDSNGELLIIGGNTELPESCIGSSCGGPDVKSITYDPDNDTLYVVVYQLHLNKGSIYYYKGKDWVLYDDKNVSGVEYKNGLLYAIDVDSPNRVVMYESSAQYEIATLPIMDDQSSYSLVCDNIIVNDVGSVAYLSCNTGLYLFNLDTEVWERIYLYSSSPATPDMAPSKDYDSSSQYPYLLSEITESANTGRIYGLAPNGIYEITPDVNNLSASHLSDMSRGAIYFDSSALHFFNDITDTLYNYSEGSFQKSKQITDLAVTYKSVDSICYNSSTGKAYGMVGTQVFDIINDGVEETGYGISDIGNDCKYALEGDELSGIDTYTAYGDIIQYVKATESGNEFAVTAEGKLIARSNSLAWEELKTSLDSLYVTTVMTNESGSELYIGTKENGFFVVKEVK